VSEPNRATIQSERGAFDETSRLGCDRVEVVEPQREPDQIERDEHEILS